MSSFQKCLTSNASLSTQDAINVCSVTMYQLCKDSSKTVADYNNCMTKNGIPTSGTVIPTIKQAPAVTGGTVTITPAKSSSTVLIVVGVAGGVIVIGLLIWFLLHH